MSFRHGIAVTEIGLASSPSGGTTFLQPITLPPVALQVDAAVAVTLQGGIEGSNYEIASGALPPGLDLDLESLQLSGTPDTAGAYAIVLRQTNARAVNSPLDSEIAFTVAVVTPQLHDLTFTPVANVYANAAPGSAIGAFGGISAGGTIALSGDDVAAGRVALAGDGFTVVVGASGIAGVASLRFTATETNAAATPDAHISPEAEVAVAGPFLPAATFTPVGGLLAAASDGAKVGTIGAGYGATSYSLTGASSALLKIVGNEVQVGASGIGGESALSFKIKSNLAGAANDGREDGPFTVNVQVAAGFAFDDDPEWLQPKDGGGFEAAEPRIDNDDVILKLATASGGTGNVTYEVELRNADTEDVLVPRGDPEEIDLSALVETLEGVTLKGTQWAIDSASPANEISVAIPDFGPLVIPEYGVIVAMGGFRGAVDYTGVPKNVFLTVPANAVGDPAGAAAPPQLQAYDDMRLITEDGTDYGSGGGVAATFNSFSGDDAALFGYVNLGSTLQYFSVALPNGVYRARLVSGNLSTASATDNMALMDGGKDGAALFDNVDGTSYASKTIVVLGEQDGEPVWTAASRSEVNGWIWGDASEGVWSPAFEVTQGRVTIRRSPEITVGVRYLVGYAFKRMPTVEV